jgi:hypothetical protein
MFRPLLENCAGSPPSIACRLRGVPPLRAVSRPDVRPWQMRQTSGCLGPVRPPKPPPLRCARYERLRLRMSMLGRIETSMASCAVGGASSLWFSTRTYKDFRSSLDGSTLTRSVW